ncbi:MAG TPA: secretion protein [Polyangia bacterium]|jgi:type III secretion protein J
MRALAAAVLFTCISGCSNVELQHGLDERQANQIVLTLDQAGITADKLKEEGGREATFRVRVAGADAAQAWKVLKAHELPRERAKGLLEVFGQPSLIPTATQERALHLTALCGELSRTLETVDGVLTARVHVSLPDDNPLREGAERVRPAAAVLIKARPGTALGEDEVRKLVAGSVDGLDPAKVSVVITAAQAAPATVGSDLAHLGPFRVARASRGPLLATLLGLLGLILLLALVLVVTALRASRARTAALDAVGPTGEPLTTRGSVVSMGRGPAR